jgi:hypothetical protein
LACAKTIEAGLKEVRELFQSTIATCLMVGSAAAQTWTQSLAPTNAWNIISISANGRTLAGAEFPDLDVVWVSTNAGTTWTSNAIAGIPNSSRIEDLAMSATGDKLAAVAIDVPAIFTSTNFGATWMSNSAPVEPWYRLACSADGSRLVALGGGLIDVSPIFVSTDSGNTWTPANAPITNWVSVAASANGSNWVAAVEQQPSGGTIYTSTDGGFNWTLMTNAPNIEWISVASSADGSKIAAANPLGPLYTSADFGLTWISNSTPYEGWVSVASSADGRILAAAAYYDLMGGPALIFTSTNSGVTWLSNSAPPLQWSHITTSADGAVLWASGQTENSSVGALFTSQSVRNPQLNISSVGPNLALSWLLPSTSFQLQQNFNLSATNWIFVTNPPVLNLNDLSETITQSPSNFAGFYRLASP